MEGIHNWIEHRSESDPDKPAIVFMNRQYSYAELAGRIARLTAVFEREFGISEYDRVAFLGNNSPRLIEALFACARMGAILVPLNWRLAVPELLQIMADADVSLLIVGPDQLEKATAITTLLDGCRPVHAYRNPGIDAWPCLQTLLRQATVVSADTRDLSQHSVLILYTSGTTGKPKGVVLTQAALTWSARNSVAMHGMTAADHILMVLPMFHAGGFNIHTLPALYMGATITLHEGFDPGAVLSEITSGRPSLTGLVPAQINAMCAHPDWAGADLSQLRCVTTGSTVVPESCIRVWVERGVTALQVYGATETCAIAIHQSDANAAQTAGSVGYAAKYCQARIVDDDGLVVTAGQKGEILIKGANVFTQYWRNSSATRDALRDDWFHTGDIGFQRPDGSYIISDRKADMIISGGENIYPAELEAILDEHAEIVEAAVVGQMDKQWGEVAVAVVVKSDGSRLDQNDVGALFIDRLARYKHPRRVVMVDSLPRNAMGKIEKIELRRRIASKQES